MGGEGERIEIKAFTFMKKSFNTKRARSFPPKRDQRFRQLLQLAQDGNQVAVTDLWREYGYRFGKGAK